MVIDSLSSQFYRNRRYVAVSGKPNHTCCALWLCQREAPKTRVSLHHSQRQAQPSKACAKWSASQRRRLQTRSAVTGMLNFRWIHEMGKQLLRSTVDTSTRDLNRPGFDDYQEPLATQETKTLDRVHDIHGIFYGLYCWSPWSPLNPRIHGLDGWSPWHPWDPWKPWSPWIPLEEPMVSSKCSMEFHGRHVDEHALSRTET